MLRLSYYEGEEFVTIIFNTRVKCYSYIYDHNLTEYWLNGVYCLCA